MTQIDLGNIRINWRGTYNSNTNYVRHDAVAYQGSSYIAKKIILGVTPVQGADWDLMAAGTDQLIEEGDLLIHNGTVPTRLARGGNTQILQMVGKQPAWRNQSLDPSRYVWKIAKVNGTGGSYTRVYLMADGTIKACGSGVNYSNGDSAGMNIYTPKRVVTEDPDVRFIDVFSGIMQHYGLTQDGEVWSWGFNNYGQLGHGNTINLAVAKQIKYFIQNNIKISKIVTGRSGYRSYSCTYFLSNDGRVYACGINDNGNLGNGTSDNQYTPIRCGNLTNIVDIFTSGWPYTTYAIQDNGQLWVWGCNDTGQLGLGDTKNRYTPILNPAFNNVVKALPSCGFSADVKAKGGYGLILLSDGTAWSTGFNNEGQLGLGDIKQRTSFTQIPNIIFKNISLGDGYCGTSAGITYGGEIYLWGHNSFGQLGTGDLKNQLSPQKPSGNFQGHVNKVAFGGALTASGCILQANNRLWAAGYSNKGNLGTNSFSLINYKFQPVLGQFGKIADWNCYGNGGGLWGLGVLYNDGRVDACGNNSVYGETGTQVGNLHNIATLTNVIF